MNVYIYMNTYIYIYMNIYICMTILEQKEYELRQEYLMALKCIRSPTPGWLQA